MLNLTSVGLQFTSCSPLAFVEFGDAGQRRDSLRGSAINDVRQARAG